jgi:hypothetical protein
VLCRTINVLHTIYGRKYYTKIQKDGRERYKVLETAQQSYLPFWRHGQVNASHSSVRMANMPGTSTLPSSSILVTLYQLFCKGSVQSVLILGEGKGYVHALCNALSTHIGVGTGGAPPPFITAKVYIIIGLAPSPSHRIRFGIPVKFR